MLKMFRTCSYYYCPSSLAIGEWPILFLLSVHFAKYFCILLRMFPPFCHQPVNSSLLCKMQTRVTLSVACLSLCPTNALPTDEARLRHPAPPLPLDALLHAGPHCLSPGSIHAGPHLKDHFLILKWMCYPRCSRQASSLPVCNFRNSVLAIQGRSLLNCSDSIICISLSSFFYSCWWQHNSVQHWKAGGTVPHVLPSDDKCSLLVPWAKCLFQMPLSVNASSCKAQAALTGWEILWTESKVVFFSSRLLRSSLLHGCFLYSTLQCHPGVLSAPSTLSPLLQLEKICLLPSQQLLLLNFSLPSCMWWQWPACGTEDL